MQRIANYGSFLQAYGLKSILEELGHEVQFVDYHVGVPLLSTSEKTGLTRTISKVVESLKYNAPFKEKMRFIVYKYRYASNYYPYLEISKKMNYTPELDVLIIGSDEVFNCVQDNTNVGFSPELFGVGNRAKKVISYAASFGNTTIDKLKKYNISYQIGEWLKNFDAISVRDNNSGRIVELLTGNVPEYHLDPVLMYDFSSKCKSIAIKQNIDKYLILYGYSGRFSSQECETIHIYAKERNLKIYCIGGVQNVCDKFIDCSPFSVISYFQNAECVVTDTFHGTILSTITHKKFVTFVRKLGYGNSEKIVDLMQRLRITDRIITNLNELADKLDKPIDYKIVDDIINKERVRSYEYLENQLKWI